MLKDGGGGELIHVWLTGICSILGDENIYFH